MSVEAHDREYFKPKNYATLMQAAFYNGNKTSRGPYKVNLQAACGPWFVSFRPLDFNVFAKGVDTVKSKYL